METTIRLHDNDLEHSLMKEQLDVHMFFFPFYVLAFQI